MFLLHRCEKLAVHPESPEDLPPPHAIIGGSSLPCSKNLPPSTLTTRSAVQPCHILQQQGTSAAFTDESSKQNGCQNKENTKNCNRHSSPSKKEEIPLQNSKKTAEEKHTRVQQMPPHIRLPTIPEIQPGGSERRLAGPRKPKLKRSGNQTHGCHPGNRFLPLWYHTMDYSLSLSIVLGGIIPLR